MEKFRLGIVGVGFIGEVHIQAYESLPEIEVAAICEINPVRLAEIKSKYGIPAAYTSMEAMLEKEKLDGVLIATPDQLHVEPVRIAAKAGMPFLLEKPIATNMADAKAIIELAEASGVPALQGISMQFYPPYVQIRERWKTGEFGQAHTAYAARMLNISDARRFQGRCSVNEYIACHDFHFLLSVFGPDVESIFAQKINSRVYEETGVADSYWNLIRWKNGGCASVLMTWAMPSGFSYVEDSVLIIGSKGSAEKPPDQSLRFVTDDRDEKIATDPTLTGLEEYQGEMLHFRDMVFKGVAPAVTLRHGLLVQKLVWAADESVKKGCPVKVDL